MTMQEMKRLYDKVGEMKTQRQNLEQQLRDALQKDDLTSTLVLQGDKDQQEFFNEQLHKHDKTVSLIDQNLLAQGNILRVLTETNAKYGRIRKENADCTRQREAKIADMIQSYDVYTDLLSKTERGRQFYGKLDTKVKHLLERTQEACRGQQEERTRILERLAPKVPPPARPTAPKPGQPQLPAGAPFDMQFNMNLPNSYMPVQNMPMMPPVGPEPPKLKDFLPFMKPGTFGPKSRAAGSSLGAMDCAPGSAGSLPPSISASPVHIPHGPVSLPPSPQRQPVPPVTSNGYASVPGSMPISASAGAGVMSADSLLSPTAPPGAPRSSSPAHQPQMPMHPGGPAESHMHQYGSGQEPPNSWHQSMQTSVYPPSLDSRVPASSGVALPTSAEAQAYNPSSTGCSQPSSWSNVATVQGPIYSSSGMTGVGLPQVYPSDHLRQYGGVTSTGVGITSTLPQTGSTSNRSQADTWFASQHQPGRLPDVVDSGQNIVSGGSAQLPVSSGAAGGFNVQQRLPSTNTPFAAYPTGTVGRHTPGQNIQQPGDGQFMEGGFVPASQSMSGPQFSAPLPGNSSVQGGYMVGPSNVYQSAQAVSQPPPSYSTVCSSNLAMQPTHPPMSAQSGYLPVQSGTQVPGNFAPGHFAPVPTGSQAHPLSQVPIHSQQQPGPGSDYTSQGFSAVRQPPGQNVQQPLGYLPANQPQPMSTPGGITYPMVSHTQPQVLPTNRPYSGPGPQSQAQPLQYASNIQNQSQYPVPSQTFPGQSASGQQMTRYPAVSQSGYPGGGHPSSGYPQAPGGAVHPGVPQPGYPASAQQQPRYPMPNQPVTSQTQQPYPVRFQQPQDFSGAPQPQIPLTNQTLPYPPAGQPPYPQEPSQRPGVNPSYAPYQHQVKGQGSAFQPTGQQIGQHVAYPPTNQQHPGYAPVPNNQPQNVYQQNSSYQQSVGGNPNGHNASLQSFPASNQPMMQQPPVNSVPGTSQAAEIIPACLPSPLQPSRIVTSIISKGVESLCDLDLTTSTTTQSTVKAGGDFQNVSQPCTVDKTSVSSGVKGFDDSLDKGAVSTPALQPEVVSAEEQRERREEETRRSLQHSRSARDPYSDADAMARFSADVEKFQKHVDALLKPTLGGYLPLDKEWKDVNEDQDKMTRQFSMAIARCYPMKNRFADVMPFDSSRVVLTGAADDYINASHLGSFSVGCPNFIATQAPLPATFVDFWQMVYDQGTETIVALCVEQEPGSKNHVYWPVDKGQSVVHGAFTIALQSSKNKQAWIERILTISHKATHQSRSIVHLQFLCWPPAGVPESPAQLLQFVIEVQSFYRQQRSLTKPIIVHCSNGIGRTGAFCVVYIGVDEIDQGDGIVQVPEVVSRLRRQRRSMVQYKEQLKFCYDTILCYAQDLLMRHGVLVSRTLAGKLTDRSLGRVPSEDLVLGLPNLSAIQSSVAKMNVRPPRTQTDSIPSETPISEAGSRSENASVDSSEGLSASVEIFGRTSEEKSRSSSPCSVGSSSVGLSPQHLPAVEQQRAESSPSLTNLPPSLMDLQNPANFQLEASTSAHRKITKASFFDPSRPSLGTSSSGPTDSADPLSHLDPMWTLKGN